MATLLTLKSTICIKLSVSHKTIVILLWDFFVYSSSSFLFFFFLWSLLLLFLLSCSFNSICIFFFRETQTWQSIFYVLFEFERGVECLYSEFFFPKPLPDTRQDIFILIEGERERSPRDIKEKLLFEVNTKSF